MTSFNIQTITHAIIFILRFKSDKQTDDFLLTDDLRTVQLQNFLDIFQGDRDHHFSRFKARNYDFESDDLVLREIRNRHQGRPFIQRNHNSGCLICFGIEANKMFREIHIPVSKALFLKVINFSPSQDAELSIREVYDTIYNLFMILDNTNIIACILLKQLLADKELFDELSILHQENIHSVMSNYQGTQEAESIEIENQEHILHSAFLNIHHIAMQEFVFVYKDEHNNVALTASKSDNKRKPHVTININLKDLWRPFCYLKLDSAFLSQNSSLLHELLYRNSLFRSNVTLDIDFTKSQQLFKFLPKHSREALRQPDVFEALLPIIFKHISAFRLRLSEMTCSIDFRVLLDKKTMLLCNEILFTSAVYLPQNLWSIHIHDSGIAGYLILPANTKTLSLKRVLIDREAIVIVNDGCLRVEIENSVGDIDISSAFGIDALSFNKQWKKCHILRNSMGGIEELSIVEANLSQSWDISTGIKKVYLEHIKSEGYFWVTINADCEKLSLKNCRGIYCLVENALLSNLGILALTIDKEFHLSSENGQYKLSMVNICLNTVTTLNEKIKILEAKNVHVQRGALLSSHMDCQNICLKNCRGSFGFFFGTSQRRINLSRRSNAFSLQFNEHTGKYKMSLIEVNIDASWMFSEELEDLHLESITNESSEHFEIKEGCNSVRLLKCNGLFKIPGIQNASQGVLQLSISTNELCLTKLPCNLFRLHMSDIVVHQTIHILLDIRVGKFERILSDDNQQIKFEGRCEILFLMNCDVLFDQSRTSIYERLILNKMFEISRILNIQTKELFMNNCKIIKDVQLCETLYKLHLYDVEVVEKNTVTITKRCLNVIIRNCLGAFLIPGWNEDGHQITTFFRKAGNFCFYQYKGSDHYLLKIENCDIYGRMCIRRNIKDVILSNITFISRHTEQMIVRKTIRDAEWLESLTLKSCSFLYNFTVHVNLIHLHLERMHFNHDLIIGGGIKSLILKDVTIERKSSVILGENILYLEIYNINGVLNFNGLLNLKQLCFFGNEKVVYEKKLQSGIVHLEVENLTFASDYRLADEVKTFHLTQIKTENNSKILVNKSCEKIVTNFEGIIYFIEEQNVKKAVFINLIPLFEPGRWTFAASNDIMEIRTPSHLKSIRLENIKLTSTTVTINECCEDVSLVHCIVNINLAYIQRLSKLTLYPEPFEKTFLGFPSPIYLDELDLAFNFTLDHFEYLLFNCFNIRTLTLRAFTFTPSNSNWLVLLTSDTKPFLSLFENFYLDKLKKSLKENFPSDENTGSIWILLNERMNVLITPIFNTRSQFKLETLTIVGFYLSDRNTERLSNFSVMRKLSVDYNFVSIELFVHLPPNLETLEILSSDIFEPDNKNSLKNERNVEAIKNIEGPKILIIEGSFFEASYNFSNLPRNLHTLKISYHDMTGIVYEPSVEKIRLRELIVFFKSTKNIKRQLGLTSIEKKIHIQEMFKYLGDFIDFSRLDSLVVEDGDEKTEYDQFEIY